MTECSIATTMNGIVDSIRELQVRVESITPTISLPSNLISLCGDGGGSGLLVQLYDAVYTFVQEAGSDIVENVERPSIPDCYTGDALIAIDAWIDGIELSSLSLEDFVGIAWIDEARQVYTPSGDSVYLSDMEEYNGLLEEYNVVSGCLVPGGTYIDVIPSGEVPTTISIEEVGRGTDDLATYVGHYNRIRGDIDPKNILLVVDNSGSMSTDTIRPPYDEFVQWLIDNTTASIYESEFTDERWVKRLSEMIQGQIGVTRIR